MALDAEIGGRTLARWQVPAALTNVAPERRIDVVLTAWFAYLARVCDTIALEVGWMAPRSSPRAAAMVPWRIEVDLEAGFEQACTAVAARRAALAADVPPRHDVVARNAAGGDAAAWTLVIARADGRFRLVHDSGRRSTDAARSIVARLQRLLRSAVDPALAGRAVARLGLLPADERRLLLDDWGRSTATGTTECVHRLFEAQARATPLAIAVVHGDVCLTYAELDARANRLAHRLIAGGVVPGDRVALVLPRGVDLVVAELGVLKAGAAYVPIDPEVPQARRDWITRDSAARCVLIEVDAAEQPQHDPALALSPEQPAYVMYTSGSTGTPKGVVVPHRAIGRVVRDNGYAPFDASDRVAFVANPAFDASTMEVWAPLVNGGCVVVIDADTALDPQRFARALQQHAVTALWLTTTLFNQYVRAIPQALARLRYLLSGGERNDPSSFAMVLAHGGPQHLIHGYGPTETTTFALTCRIARVEAGTVNLPIGRPIASTSVYLLDSHGQPVPAGSQGELCIGGAGVAQGYLNRPALTAERFVPDPFGPPGARLYRTGDLARHLPDGNLVFLGRNDQQVKIRGFRIEPGEIEARLREHADVREAVVLAQDGPAGDRRLVAYVVGSAGAAALRSHLARSLPQHMLPAAYVRLDALPLTPNGKLDREALPAPGDDAVVHEVHEAPIGEIESTLAAWWSELLGVERIGRHDNFFALGGHSLLAVRLASRIREHLHAEIRVADLFAAPTLAALASVLAAAAVVPAGPSIERLPRDGVLPLSFAQERLWFLGELDAAASAAYHVPLALRIRGALDVDAWQRALDHLWARHDAWRSVFVAVDGVPRVTLLPPALGMSMRHHEMAVDDELDALCNEEASSPFDLSHGPLVRARLIRVHATEHVFLLTQHHIVSDGWSIGVLLDELDALYRAFVAGQPASLAPLPMQYPDYAAWQREWLRGKRQAQQADYWRRTLAGVGVLELPTDRPRPPRQSFEGATVPVTIDAGLVARLRALGLQHGCTLFMTVLAAWAVVLSRLSGQHDVVIGSPVANRRHPALERLVGFFVNTLALRVDVSGDPDGAQLLARVRQLATAAQDHQDLPFEQVVDIAQPPRSLDRTPLVQVLLAWQNNAPGRLAAAGLEFESLPAATPAAKFDLELELAETGDAIVGTLGYASALFDAPTIVRWRGYLLAALQAIADDPARPVVSWPLLAQDERHVLLDGWNSTAAAHAPLCIHQRFEAQVRATPDAVAVVHGDVALTYAELDVRANRLAHGLIAAGVRPDAPVALCVARSPALLVAVLAVLKAGGAYVPLDITHPAERLQALIDEVKPWRVLADASGRGALPAGVPTMDVDADLEAAGLPTHDPDVAGLSPSHLAYVIHTSGSTGRPKGVMVAHGSVVNHVEVLQRQWSIGSTDRVLQFAALGSDFSVGEIFGALSHGARLVLRDDGWLDGADTFWARCREHGVTYLDLPYQFWRLLADAPPAALPTSLRALSIGGEAAAPALLRRWLAQHALRPMLVNAYGPTEATVTATVHLPRLDDVHVDSIGRPIANTQVYLLDERGEPVPLGAVGELHVGGAGVARGYLNRPALTAERFVPDPFSGRAGARLYRTGDLARYLPDGNLVFLGRNDQQVKIRGFRIEPGEIEARLREHAQVREAVVLARETTSGDKQLVAYVVGAADAAVLRAHLAHSLPEHMLPAAYVRLDALPLTPNGKLDRRALPAPDDDALARQAYEAPAGEVETTLAALWCELLGVERVGRQDNFFALGGHSLLAVRLTSRIRQQLQAEVRIASLFTAPTLAALAAVVRQAAGVQALPPIEPLPREGTLPLSYAQERLWFLAQLDAAATAAYHMPLALRIRGALDVAAWQRALDHLWARHEAWRSVFASVEGTPQLALLPAQQGLPLLHHDVHSDEQIEALRDAEASAPFDLAHGPLVRARLLRLHANEHVFLLTQHHIVSDGWSMGVLLDELDALYRAFVAGEPASLPALPVQYPDYAAWQRQWLSGQRQAQQAQYWRRTLADVAVLELPTDRPRPSQQSFEGAAVPLVIDAALTAQLRELSLQHGCTLFMTLLAAWAVVLSRLSGQHDIVVGSPVANRRRPELEGMLGLFVNTLALRVDLSGEPDAAQLLARVRQLALHAQDHQDLPFEQVVEIAQPQRRLDRTPLVQVMFTLQNGARGRLDLPGLEFEASEGTHEQVRFDLELDLDESGETIAGALRYASALFDAATITRWRDHLLAALHGLVGQPSCAVARLPLLSDAERELLLDEWNRSVSYPVHRCIHQRFEDQVRAAPLAVAVVDGALTLSYGELNARANRLAHRLIAAGVRPDTLVALCVQPGAALVVAVLAVLKAGGAYVPLDPAYPLERLHALLGDVQPLLLLADAGAPSAVRSALPCIELDAALDGPTRDPVVPGLTPAHRAYVIHTSGSTGRPKGVMVEHAQVVRLLDAARQHFDFRASDAWSLFHSYSFDFSVWELWGALAHGARLVIVPRETARSAHALHRLVCDAGVTVLNQTPSAFKAYSEAQSSSPLAHRLRYVIFGGEALQPASLKAWFERHAGGPELVNMYGITETTVHVTHRLLRAEDTQHGHSPVGRPLADLRIVLLDAHGQPVPLGAAGEIHVGGAGLARGYLKQPALTAERFVPDAFSGQPGARLYRTGDLARWQPDGELIFLGRNDQQIKIRGFRIEPGEVEAALLQHPAVREAAVLARDASAGDKQLVAYVVTEAAAGELRRHLAQRLPEHMLPAAYVRLETLPLTTNGKLDRQALPAPDDDALARQVYEAPVGETETTLAALWTELLGVQRIGRHDNFFALGGHSLLAVRLMERLRRVGLVAEVRALFVAQTLAELAASLGLARAVVVPANLIPPGSAVITPQMLPLADLAQTEIDRVVAAVPGGAANVQDVYTLSPLQEGILFHHLLAAHGDPYIDLFEFAFDDRAQLDGYLAALQHVVDRHDILRTSFHWDGLAAPVQVVQRRAALAIVEETFDPADGPVAEQLARRHDPRRVPVDLGRAPLLHVHVAHDAAAGRWIVLELIHHLVVDNRSLALKDFETRMHMAGLQAHLAPPQPFRDLVAQARLGIGPDEHERHFRAVLGDVDEPTLPYGVADVQGDGIEVEEAQCRLPEALGRRLRAQARRLGVGLASLCHLAWGQVVARSSGREDVVFGTVLFGRMHGDAGDDRAMGLYINTLPLRLRLDGTPIEMAVRLTHAALADLLRHEHASLALAQRCSGVQSPSPLFGALLNYRHDVLPEQAQMAVDPLAGVEWLRDEERTNYPLAMSVDDLGDSLDLVAQAVLPLSAQRVCGAMARALEDLADALEQAPGRPARSLSVLADAERRLLLDDWNRTAQDDPSHLCAHQLFEAQVRAAPDAVALVHGDVALTYAELNAGANRLAHRLVAAGVRPDTLVALCVGRSAAMVVALLAVMKAGGAYVPLDPAYPAERLQALLHDVQPRLLLTDAAGRATLDTAVPCLDVDAAVDGPAHDPVIAGLTPAHLAYVIHTSGSSGRPKGVMVAHRGLTSLAWAQRGLFEVSAHSRIVQFASLSFDASIFEIVMALGAGAALHLPRAAEREPGAPLWDYLARHAITHATLPPAICPEHAWGETLQALILAGESPRAAQVNALHPATRVYNAYGPTETTVCATAWLRPSASAEEGPVPIGRPIGNTCVYLLDERGEPVPLGAVGELHVGGAGVARGYLNRPALTAERFVPDPFSGRAGARLYRTGDLARYLPEGNLVFLGRNDQQVKIRGFRIEPGEIESRLREHAQVREAVVLARETTSGDKQLVAYVVGAADAAALRAHLAHTLPEHMLPAAYVRLDALPLTPNGKLDRRALPAPDDDALARQAYEAPAGEVETTLAALWCELLGVERVGRHDNFFALGGHSLLAVRLTSRIRQQLQAEVRIASLFTAPTLAALAAVVRQAAGVQALPPIEPLPREGTLPLSYAQERLWFLAQLDAAATAAYHMPLALRIRGALDVAAWQRALDHLWARHEAWRSVFASVEGTPQLALLPAQQGLPLLHHDVHSDEQIEALRDAEASAPFDLAHGPLVRARLLRLHANEHVFLLTQHHIVSDGWSMGVLLDELDALYRAFVAGEPASLPALPVQYPDYAAWQRQWLSGQRQAQQAQYWRRTLADVAVLELPTDRPRPSQQSFEGAAVPLVIDAALTAQLRELSLQHGCTLFMTLLAAWAVVLSRLSGQHDIVVGSPVANRRRPELEGMLGLFVNTLALRVDLSGEPDAAQLLARVRQLALHAQDHQDLPFEQVVEIAQPQRRLDRTPLVQVMFTLQNGARGRLDLPGLEFEASEGTHEQVRFDLELDLDESGETIAGALRYASALFDAATITRWRDHLLAALHGLVGQPSCAVARLPLLSDAERRLLVDEWGRAPSGGAAVCVHRLFEAQARATPSAVAVVQGDVRVTYAELDARANRLAHRLIAAGVLPGERIALVLPRSVDLVVAELGVLKAGAAYVPIDPEVPQARRDWITRDCAARLVLTDVDATAQPQHDPALALSPEQPAYVMYTSGSTGTPKGVVVPHRAIGRVVRDNGYAPFDASDRVAFVANPAFDASTMEVWAPLVNGGCVVVIDADTAFDPQRFARALQQHAVTTLFVTTVLFNQYARAIPQALARLRYLLCGGERNDPSSFAMVLAHGGPRHLIHCYGPTETTTYALTCPITRVDDAVNLPIGRPIAGTDVYLLDGHGQPVPLGAPGELYIGGAGLAHGYLNRPALTAERFVPDPFGPAGARLYRTGDLARYLPEGNLVFLGRNDQQLKIRGFRIEPGEIEARLREHAQVQEAVVLARDAASGDKQLVAYVVGAADAAALRAHLAHTLPEHMLPAAYVRLDALPLTRNGKLDRQALPAPDDDALARQAYEAPVGATETTLAALWCELLGVQRVGRHDNFFALGGHSLLAVRLMERLRRAGLVAEVRTLFASPTLAELAASLGDVDAVTVPPNLIAPGTAIRPEQLPLAELTQPEIDAIVALVPGGVANVQDIYALSPLQEGILFHHLLARDGDPYLLVAQMAFPERALLERYLNAVQQVVDRHDILRTSFHWQGLGAPVQVVHRRAALSIVEEQFDAAAGPVQEQLAQRHDPRRRRIDLTQAPLLRFHIAHDPADGRWQLLQLQHHLIGDHSTLEILHAEVRAVLLERQHELPAPHPFRELVAHARLGLSEQQHERYFSERLADVDEPTLPYGVSNVHRDGVAVEQAHVMLAQPLQQRLRAQARRLGVSLASLCHLAWGQVVARTSGREDVVFGTVLFGRMHGGAGADRAMGLYINTLPLRLSLDGTPVAEATRRTHALLAELLRHEHAPLALAQRCSGVAPPAPLFAALLNVRHNVQPADAADAADPLAGVEWLDGTERTNYPVAMSVEDTGDALGLTAQVAHPLSAQRMCDSLAAALEDLAHALAEAPERPVRSLAVLGRAERRLLIEDWNRTAIAHEPQCVHRRFEAQVRARPDAVAVVQGDVALSYAKLNARANRLAHRLIAAGVRPDTLVALCAERSPAMVVAVLAVLKAGGAYVPMDPAYPAERLHSLLDDVRPPLLLLDAAGRAVIQTGVPCLDIDAALDGPAHDPLVAGLTPAHLSYVIHTSGSTGRPKGVMVAHRELDNLVGWHVRAFELRAGQRTPATASIGFDASVWELWPSLCAGATVLLPPPDAQRDVAALLRWCSGQRAQVGFLATPLAETALADGLLDPSLQHLLIGGDRLQRWPEALPPTTTLVNNYGPTECTVVATSGVLAGRDAPLHIGRPIANTQVYLLDERGEPVPLGAVGELHVGGAGVARGYLNRPALTAERFVPDPFSGRAGARLYRTGDLARYLPEGNLVFLGRNDQQVKIRGFRIEPGEIEARLREHAQVREAVVLARETTSGDKQLVAYVVGAADAAALRAHLAHTLPEHMLPAAYVRLDALPLTPNGKLDRQALPAPDDDALARQAYEAPAGEVETTLAALWCELLGVQRVGRHDNFFALGGHSLLAVRLMERLRRAGLVAEVRTLFASPTLAELAATLSHLDAVTVPPNLIVPDATAITRSMLPLAELTQAEIELVVAAVPGGAANVQDIYALSPLQEGILFHHLLARESDPYLLQARATFPDRALLERYLGAVQRVVDRHDILRTSFHWQGLRAPVQVVHRQASLSIVEGEFDPDAGIDLTQAPLLRFHVTRDPVDGRWHLQHVQHHLVGDHSTLEILQGEVRLLLLGRGHELLPPHPFRELVAQARLGLSDEAHERYFRVHLGDITEPTLPYGVADVHGDGAGVDEARARVSDSLDRRLRAQARRLGVSLASLCHLAWGQVVARASDREDVVFGTVLFGRMHGGAGDERAMGLYINTLPLRLQLDAMPVADAVRRTHGLLADLLRHEHAPLALAQRCSGVQAPAPLFGALINYRHGRLADDEPAADDPLAAVEWSGATERTNYPVTLSLDDWGSALELSVLAVQPLSARRVCDGMTAALEDLAQALEQAPGRPVRSLSTLSDAERELLLDEWNRSVSYPVHRCIHQRFEDQVRAAPLAVAVVDGALTLSYGELNARANRLAHRLIAAGVRPDTLVALCVQPGAALVVAVLAVLKAGGAYVPLDPAYPLERLHALLGDVQPLLLLADAGAPSAVRSALPCIELDAALDGPTRDPVVPGLTPAHRAYVIHTSGSTGRPKGVMVEHAQVVRLLDAARQHFDFRASDAWSLFHSYSFDFSVWELWGALAHGARLVIVPRETARSAHALHRLVCDAGVTVLNQTPSAFKAYSEAQSSSPLAHRLRYVIFGGEALQPASLKAWFERHAGGPELVNMYGITETTVHVTHRLLRAEDTQHGHSPVGRPLADLRIVLLDAHGQPVPLGAAGEIHVGGAGLARGYLKQPALTAERFVPDAFSGQPGARLYRTGDLARWQPDGELIFLGRNDQQIKIRGFRIEPGEVEAALLQHPAVREAAVLARDASAGDKQLVAYVVTEAAAGELRRHLAQRLPEHMLPAAYVRLETLPLTTNGKLDRQALPAPDDDALARQVYEAPVGETETTLAALWTELLGVQRIGRHDNFFALGGHSLLAVRLMARLWAEFHIDVPMAAVFNCPSLALLADEILLLTIEQAFAAHDDELTASEAP